MTPALRKAHRIIWFVLAGLLPLAWVAAIRVIPGDIWQQPIRSAEPDALPELVLSRQSGDFLFNLRQEKSGAHRQLEIVISKPLEQPAVTVVAEGQPDQVLGLLSHPGICRFNLDRLENDRTPFRIRLEDRINRRTIRTVTLQ